MGQCGVSLPVIAFVENLIHSVAKPGQNPIKIVKLPACDLQNLHNSHVCEGIKTKPEAKPVLNPPESKDRLVLKHEIERD